jgi:conjugal transfer pilus assembly protein TraW
VAIFASLALGADGLRELFAAAAATPGAIVVFRGLPPAVGLRAFLATVHGLLDGLEAAPAVLIDPLRFRSASVTVVPEIVATVDGIEQARVRGLADPRWLLGELEAGHHGDLGAYGPTVAVAEADLLELLRTRVAALDGEGLRARVLERFWDRVAFVALPEASEARERRLDPTVVATEALHAPDGTVLVRAGEAVNPLARLPFSRRLVVFDATRPAQVEAARRLAAEDPRRAVLLASALERAQGWDGLAALEASLGAPVYLLTPEVRARFALERVPVEVRAEAGVFVVREVAP